MKRLFSCAGALFSALALGLLAGCTDTGDAADAGWDAGNDAGMDAADGANADDGAAGDDGDAGAPADDGGPADAGADLGPDEDPPDPLQCQPGAAPSQNVRDQVRLAIITDDALVDAFRDFADWKCEKGVPTEIVATSWIAANVAGADLPARIRRYIQERKATGLAYVLLGGDAELVPPRQVHTRALLQYDDTFASDFYYSDLDGTWDGNGNGTYGELADGCEMHPDIAVGRVPASTEADVTAFTDRLLFYEQQDAGDAHKALFISEDTGFLNFDSALQLNPLAENVFPASFAKQKLYWKYQSYPGASENTLAAQVAALAAGQGFVTHYGHASEFDLNMEMDFGDVDQLTNSPHFPVYVTCGCQAGNFAFEPQDSAGERLLTNPRGGAVAYLGNSNIGLGPGGGTALIEAFYRAVFGGTTRLGDALNTARNTFFSQESSLQSELLGIRWTQFVVTLLGDPEMEIRTEPPRQLQMFHERRMPQGEQCLEVEVRRDSSPLSGARVTLYRAGVFLYSQTTDSAGKTVFRFAPGGPGVFQVTATFPQSIPALSSVRVF